MIGAELLRGRLPSKIHVCSELFENNVNLKRIEVKENLISFISIKLFKNTKNLEQLYLHENKIRKLRPKE